MSVFHRIDDVHEMCGATFFKRAERLPFYDGAVKGRMLLEISEDSDSYRAPTSGAPVRNPNAREVPSDRGALAFNFPEMGIRTVKKAG